MFEETIAPRSMAFALGAFEKQGLYLKSKNVPLGKPKQEFMHRALSALHKYTSMKLGSFSAAVSTGKLGTALKLHQLLAL